VIELIQGDILESPAEALVNTVNCAGVMGRGIALQFKKAYPNNYKIYKEVCKRKELNIGQMLVYETGSLTFPRYIINFPTKKHWKGKSKISDIETGLQSLIQKIRTLKIESIAVPPLGCGLGGLQWRDVKPIIEKAFQQEPEVKVYLHEPTEIRHVEPVSTKMPDMTIGRATLLGLMQKYISVAMDWVSLLEIHKLMYLMQESGENLKLKYEKKTYGPFASNLRHVLNHIEGHYIRGYSDTADKPNTQIQLIQENLGSVDEFLHQHRDSLKRFDVVVNLIKGFETSYGMELLTTIHWVATREKAVTLDEVVEKTHQWNNRKKMFSRDEIQIAWETLKNKHWLDS
jgi:O-acetyl-ADP-ribose deacetylase (regulator of RNase III)